MKHKKHRRNISCWLKWSIDTEGKRTVQLWYWRAPIFSLEVPSSTATAWYNAEQQAKAWARRKKFFFVKEYLHND